MVKGSFQDRSKLLFKFYDLNNSGGVSYNQLLKMVFSFLIKLYSYPKEDLREMLTETNFVKTIDDYQLLNFFKPDQATNEKDLFE